MPANLSKFPQMCPNVEGTRNTDFSSQRLSVSDAVRQRDSSFPRSSHTGPSSHVILTQLFCFLLPPSCVNPASAPYYQLPAPCSLLPAPCSLLPVLPFPCSLLPASFSQFCLLPAPCLIQFCSSTLNSVILNGCYLTQLTLKRNIPNNMFLNEIGEQFFLGVILLRDISRLHNPRNISVFALPPWAQSRKYCHIVVKNEFTYDSYRYMYIYFFFDHHNYHFKRLLINLGLIQVEIVPVYRSWISPVLR